MDVKNEASLLWQRSGPCCLTVQFSKSKKNWEEKVPIKKGLWLLKNHLHVNNKNKQVLLILELGGASLRVVFASTCRGGFTSVCLPVYSWLQREQPAFHPVCTVSKKYNLQISSVVGRQSTIKKNNCGNFGVFIKCVLMGKDKYNNKVILLLTVVNISPNFINNIILKGRKTGIVHLVVIRRVK